MENFKEIAEKCLAGELSGTFILHNGEKKHVSKKNQTIRKDYLDPYSPYIIGNRKYSRCGVILPISNAENPYDIIDFIPDNMTQKKIEIDIPEGKVPVMEQTEKGVVITWKEKEITYADVISKLVSNQNAIYEFWSDKIHEGESSKFYKKVEVLRKLTNIRNYFGKPSDKSYYGWVVCSNGTTHEAVVEYPHLPLFAKKEHAEQAIKMLGDELKYLFEPW